MASGNVTSPARNTEARQRVAWTETEDAALRKGMGIYGMLPLKWSEILKDQELGETLVGRRNTDLKDRWRTLTGGGIQRGVNAVYNEGRSASPLKVSPAIKRARAAKAAASAPGFVYAILRQTKIRAVGGGYDKLDKKTKQEVTKLEATPPEVLDPVYDDDRVAAEAMRVAMVTYLNEIFDEKISPDYQPGDSEAASAKGASGGGSSSSNSGSAFTVVSQDEDLEGCAAKALRYTFPAGVKCSGKKRTILGGTVDYKVCKLALARDGGK